MIANYTAFQQDPGRLRPGHMNTAPSPRRRAGTLQSSGRGNLPVRSRGQALNPGGPGTPGPQPGTTSGAAGPRASSLRLVWVYPDLLSTYGDRGNLLVLERRARLRGIETESVRVQADQPVPRQGDIYLIGGGEDLPQILAPLQGLRADGELWPALVSLGAVVFAVCAGYQLIGTEFAGEEGQPVPGLEIADLRGGRGDRRAVGEVLADVDPALGLPRLTGFENHQGVTRLGPGARPLARVEAGIGNGDGTEGAYAGRVLGTYLHGPALVRNPALADLLLGWAAGPLPELPAADEEWGRRLRDERLAASLVSTVSGIARASWLGRALGRRLRDGRLAAVFRTRVPVGEGQYTMA